MDEIARSMQFCTRTLPGYGADAQAVFRREPRHRLARAGGMKVDEVLRHGEHVAAAARNGGSATWSDGSNTDEIEVRGGGLEPISSCEIVEETRVRMGRKGHRGASIAPPWGSELAA